MLAITITNSIHRRSMQTQITQLKSAIENLPALLVVIYLADWVRIRARTDSRATVRRGDQSSRMVCEIKLSSVRLAFVVPKIQTDLSLVPPRHLVKTGIKATKTTSKEKPVLMLTLHRRHSTSDQVWTQCLSLRKRTKRSRRTSILAPWLV